MERNQPRNPKKENRTEKREKRGERERRERREKERRGHTTHLTPTNLRMWRGVSSQYQNKSSCEGSVGQEELRSGRRIIQTTGRISGKGSRKKSGKK
jgi:hypothetical protein